MTILFKKPKVKNKNDKYGILLGWKIYHTSFWLFVLAPKTRYLAFSEKIRFPKNDALKEKNCAQTYNIIIRTSQKKEGELYLCSHQSDKQSFVFPIFF